MVFDRRSTKRFGIWRFDGLQNTGKSFSYQIYNSAKSHKGGLYRKIRVIPEVKERYEETNKVAYELWPFHLFSFLGV